MTITKQPSSGRVAAIDAMRALTMFLMIFVNDLWSLKGVPKWLEHASPTEDYLGFSDVIFPLFLFIVGLSIPFAVANRQKRGDSIGKITWHIFIRSFSLILIGFYMMNMEKMAGSQVIVGRYGWELLMGAGIMLIWLDWKLTGVAQRTVYLMQGVGVLIFLFLAIVYHGGEGGEHWMQVYWWGILGLIGWAYMLNALLYVASRGHFGVIIAGWLFFNLLNIADLAGWTAGWESIRNVAGPFITGSNPALTAGGVVAAVILRKLKSAGKVKVFYRWMAVLAIIGLLYGFALRPVWGISKIQATPAWVGICSGIGFAFFGFLYRITDEWGKTSWIKILRPAGTATLTAYLLPFFIYPVRSIFGLVLPVVLRIGFIGILKSLIFALLVVLLTGWLEKHKIKLKL
jgi:predicted acyltransferase